VGSVRPRALAGRLTLPSLVPRATLVLVIGALGQDVAALTAARVEIADDQRSAAGALAVEAIDAGEDAGAWGGDWFVGHEAY